MAVATAEQIRNRKVFVQVPGLDLEIECRCPDPLVLITEGILPLETYSAVLALINEVLDTGVIFDNRPLAEGKETDPKTVSDMIARWVCAAAVAPVIVVSEDEAMADPSKLWVFDLEPAIRIEIVRRTGRRLVSSRLKTAVQEFRRQRFPGAGPGPDGAAVREDPVGVAARD